MIEAFLAFARGDTLDEPARIDPIELAGRVEAGGRRYDVPPIPPALGRMVAAGGLMAQLRMERGGG